MRVIRHCAAAPAAARGAVVALGNFDGVHRGHQAVIGAARARARDERRPAAVMTFEPHPLQLFRPDLPPRRLTPLRAKLTALAALDVDFVFLPRFDRTFAQLEAEVFARRLLVQDLGIAHAVVGADFCFGRGRKGTAETLERLGARLGFGVTQVAPVAAPDGRIFSSTAARGMIEAGDVAGARKLLGRPFEIEGRVFEGDRRGRTIGFPTANLRLGNHLVPALGVYAVRAAPSQGLTAPARWIDGVANLGRRPTVGGEDVRLEVHLFDFAGDLYHRRLRVQLVEFLRPERKFAGLDQLKAQIGEDARGAREILGAAAGRITGGDVPGTSPSGGAPPSGQPSGNQTNAA
jgi:riboflavin kinase/FMN adenylyltransferase